MNILYQDSRRITDAEFVDLLKKGEIVASGMQQPYLMGVRSGEALFKHLKGEPVEKQILVPIMVVTNKNIDEVLPTIKETVFANESLNH